MLQGTHGCFAGDGWKVIEEVIQGFPSFQVVEEGLERHTGSSKDWRSTQHSGVPDNHSIGCSHNDYRLG